MGKNSLVNKLDDMSPAAKAMFNRLRRVEGQLRGIQRMILEDKPCYDVLLQLSAARKAMQKACIEILKNYINKCVHEAQDPDLDNLEKLIEALIDIAPAGMVFKNDEDEEKNEKKAYKERPSPGDPATCGTQNTPLTAAPSRA